MNKLKLLGIGESAVRFCIWLVILATLGCATYGPDLVREGAVSVEMVNSKDARLANVGVYQENSGIVVNGRVKNRQLSFFMPAGYGQVELIAPDGTRHQQCERYPGRYGKSRRHHVYFVTQFPLLPVQGTVVRLSVHNFGCGEDLRCTQQDGTRPPGAT